MYRNCYSFNLSSFLKESRKKNRSFKGGYIDIRGVEASLKVRLVIDHDVFTSMIPPCSNADRNRRSKSSEYVENERWLINFARKNHYLYLYY